MSVPDRLFFAVVGPAGRSLDGTVVRAVCLKKGFAISVNGWGCTRLTEESRAVIIASGAPNRVCI